MGIAPPRESYVGIVLTLRAASGPARQARPACLTADSSLLPCVSEPARALGKPACAPPPYIVDVAGKRPAQPIATESTVFLQTRKHNVSAVIEHLEGEARERLIVWLTRRMQECNITLEALQHALQQDIDEAKRIRYRDAWGNTWTGDGEHPEWLRRAVAAGQSIDHFLCE